MNTLPKITLKKGRNIPILCGHPWIFSNAIEHTPSEIINGSIVEIISNEKKSLGLGIFNSLTSIRVRMLTKNPSEKIDKNFFKTRFIELAEIKKKFLPEKTNAYRLVHSDADFLGGLVVDIYNNTAVFSIDTLGMELLRKEIIEALTEFLNPRAIIERSDTQARTYEGLPVLKSTTHLGKINGFVEFEECGIKFLADVVNGQKTGFYLDQRDARIKMREFFKDKHVLNLFGYTGAFSIYALKASAKSVTTVDTSANALSIAGEILKLNGYSQESTSNAILIKEDVFDFINHTAQKGFYDVIICDPPAFAKSSQNTTNALKAYTSLNQKCIELLANNGILCTSSCSGRISLDQFQNALRLGAGHAKRDTRLICNIEQPFDHTHKLSFPEGKYLKTVIFQVFD